MRVLIQRVTRASVKIEKDIISSIDFGLLVFLGIEEKDNSENIDWLIKKIVQLRIFSDDNGLMNKSIMDIQGNILVISQFTLHAAIRKGNRPSFIRAAKTEIAIPIYDLFCSSLKDMVGKDKIKTGLFGAKMQVELINDGPVTIWIDSKNKE